jgi:hypothetical protein
MLYEFWVFIYCNIYVKYVTWDHKVEFYKRSSIYRKIGITGRGWGLVTKILYLSSFYFILHVIMKRKMKQILPTIPPISKRTTKLPLTWHHWEQKIPWYIKMGILLLVWDENNTLTFLFPWCVRLCLKKRGVVFVFFWIII